MEQPSPIKNGFDPVTKKWATEEGQENYRKEVVAYAKYVTYNQYRIKLNHGSARVDKNCSQETIDALNLLSDKVYDMDFENES